MNMSTIVRKINRIFLKGRQSILRQFLGKYPSGHYYSPIPSLMEIKKRRLDIFFKNISIKGIDLKPDEQLNKLRMMSQIVDDIPFYAEGKKIRFNIENDSFSYDDAPILHYMIRLLKPTRIIEIGSGNSSACMLDTNTLNMHNSIKFTFIDLDCKTLRKYLLKGDYNNVTVLEKPIQEIDLGIFSDLKENDILFIDSSHVIKTGSDLSTIFFNILPVLNKGVYIHFHDIRYPFEYPEDMLVGGVYWNEAYLLRAFLQFNESFQVVFWLNYILNSPLIDSGKYLDMLPLDSWSRRFNNNDKNFTGAGGSIYIKKIK